MNASRACPLVGGGCRAALQPFPDEVHGVRAATSLWMPCLGWNDVKEGWSGWISPGRRALPGLQPPLPRRQSEVRVLGEDRESLGILPIAKALQLARELDVDLILTVPEARPPLCRWAAGRGVAGGPGVGGLARGHETWLVSIACFDVAAGSLPPVSSSCMSPPPGPGDKGDGSRTQTSRLPAG